MYNQSTGGNSVKYLGDNVQMTSMEREANQRQKQTKKDGSAVLIAQAQYNKKTRHQLKLML